MMEGKEIIDQLAGNRYPGRGILAGKSPDGKKVLMAYFIMGRSQNSRNRIFVKERDDLFTKPFDPSAVEDPSLIIYRAVHQDKDYALLTNGDQTDTVLQALSQKKSFEEALRSRTFEPDAPNFTPRISLLVEDFSRQPTFRFSILKACDSEGLACSRSFFEYPAQAGVGHLIHTYEGDGSPLPSFLGEPRLLTIKAGTCEELLDTVWQALDSQNRISLYVASRDLESGRLEEKNRNARQEEEGRFQ